MGQNSLEVLESHPAGSRGKISRLFLIEVRDRDLLFRQDRNRSPARPILADDPPPYR